MCLPPKVLRKIFMKEKRSEVKWKIQYDRLIFIIVWSDASLNFHNSINFHLIFSWFSLTSDQISINLSISDFSNLSWFDKSWDAGISTYQYFETINN
jgi:hypothetical protein